MTQRVTATIDVAAIRHNLRVVRQYAPTSHVMGALKADASLGGAGVAPEDLAALQRYYQAAQTMHFHSNEGRREYHLAIMCQAGLMLFGNQYCLRQF